MNNFIAQSQLKRFLRRIGIKSAYLGIIVSFDNMIINKPGKY